jgi:phage-related holin
MLSETITSCIKSKGHLLQEHLQTLVVAILAVFAPLKTIMLALLFLIVSDLATGLWASIVTHAPLTSRRLARTVVKTLVYLTTICVVHIANRYLLSAGSFALPLDTLIVSFIALTEVKSILENLQKIQNQPFLQYIIDRLASDKSEIQGKITKKPVTRKSSKGKRRGTSKRQKLSN